VRVAWRPSGEGGFDMVAVFEIAFLVVCAVLLLWWFTRTSAYRALPRSGAEPGQGARESLGEQPPQGGPTA